MSFAGYVRKVAKRGPAGVVAEIRCIDWADSWSLLRRSLWLGIKGFAEILGSVLLETARIVLPITVVVALAVYCAKAFYQVELP